MGIFEKFKIGFKKSASTFTSGLKEIILKKEIDDKTLDQVEDYLIESDVGVAAASEIKEIISTEKIDPNKDTLNEVNIILKKYIVELMKPLEKVDFFSKKEDLKILLISGVNGVGKTTTIGKIGKILKSNSNKILFSACDTFRAAAIEQLENWAKKIDVEIIKSTQGSDPASVAYKAVDEAIKKQFTHVLIDTAGRLQNKKNLMEEYKKIFTVLKKINPEYPHETILVLDATTGQNALNQVEEFKKISNLTGLIITKMDTSAKGGILLAISKKFSIPIIAIGMGEKDTDLHPFSSDNFSKMLVDNK
mgnify:CR=1 FL=1